MRVLLDTHILLWAASDPERLGGSIEDLRHAECLVSVVSGWELAIKMGVGKVRLQTTAAAFVHYAAEEFRARLVGVDLDHAAHVERLPLHHRDPFDQMLIAQATAETASLLTADRGLQAYGEVIRVLDRR